MINQAFVILTGLALAAWGHLLIHDLLGAPDAWTRVDDLFPSGLRSSPAFAGRTLLTIGSLLVLVAIFG